MNKKILSTLLLASLLSSNILLAQNLVFAEEQTNTTEEIVVPKKIENEIFASIVQVYGEKRAKEIYERVMQIAKESIDKRSETLKNEDLTRADDWYKDEIIYMFYVDQFGVVTPEKPNTFRDTSAMFDYLKDLGVTTLYLLPFADSPMSDAGFDVKNPQNIRADLGGKTQFKEFVVEAKKNGFKIKSDLVLNHVSDEHEWFQSFLKGDVSKKDYFVVKDKMPEYKKYVDEKIGTVVEYNDGHGKISKRRLIFPEITENHYRKVVLNGEDYYFYHTFYPFQLDINWENPEVLYYWLDTINYWTNIGIDIFRMDAIPYLSKEDGTNAENLSKTHAIVKLLSNYIQMTSPRTVIQAEACQYPKDILPYFGKERKFKTTINGQEKEIKRTDEFQIAYHFPYMPAIWAALITGDKQHFINAYKDTPQIPSTAAWGVFLRVHDELTLEMIDVQTREIIYNALVSKGAEFRKGLGVSGRLANFLDNDPDRIEMAFSICGVYLLCDMLRDIECDISIVDFPKEKRDVTSSFGYSHWGILKPGEYYTYLSEAKEITKMEKQRNSDLWRSLKKENSLLRVYSDGTIRSVTPDYYDKLILNILPTQNFTLKRAIGEVMKRMPVYINLGLVEKRIFHMIENGTLCINKKDGADD